MGKTHTLHCHCNNVTISYNKAPEHLTCCNCSLCRRYAALWAYYRFDEVNVTVLNDKLNRYCWGDKSINFHSCSVCGCITHYTSVEAELNSRLAINFRMAENSTVNNLPIRLFDGADSWKIISVTNNAEFDQ